MNYGFDENLVEIKPEDYTFGRLPQSVIQTDGQWDEYLPIYEPQARMYETSGCTVWGGQNQIETYMKRCFGFEPDYDERFNYILAGVTIAGANPQDAYESFRKDGLKDDEPMPDNYQDFIDPGYITPQRINQARQWLDEYILKHEWLISPTREQIKEYLRYSPIAVSVTAWHKKDGLYVDKGLNNNHWCLCYGYVEDERGIILKIFDTYDQSLKLLHPDHNIKFGKRIFIYENTEPKKNWFESLITEIIYFFSDIIRRI